MGERSSQDPRAPDHDRPDGNRPDGRPSIGPSVASDWLTIWQSEMSALAADREAQELWAAGVAQWTAQVAGGWADLMRQAGDRPERRPGPATPPGATAAAVPSHDVADLERRIAELERRLAAAGG